MKMNPESPSLPVPSLPIEVWGQIFENIDNPLDLMRFQEVCKAWNQEINRILPHANWKKLCLLAIRAFALSSIAAAVEPSVPKINYRQINDKRFWRKVFIHYMKWITIDELPVKVVSITNKLLLSKNELITCFDIWGIWTIYGTSIGRVYVLNNQGNTQRKAIDVYERIAEVKIWRYDTDQFLFLLVTKSRMIKIGYPKMTMTLRGHKVCVGTANNLYYMQNDIIIKLRSTPPTVEVAMAIQLNFNPEEDVVAISSRESKIFVVVQVEQKLRIFTIVDESLTKQSQMFQVDSIVEAPLLPVAPLNMRVHITLNRTIICFQNEQMFLHTPKTNFWMTHDERKYFAAEVTSFIMHGPCLILGLSNGVLSMYNVESIMDLVSPPLFEQKPVKEKKLDTRPIIAIKVTDVDEEIHITAFTEMNMFKLIF